jgi:hypothetical protein
MQSILKVQQSNALNVDEWFQKQKKGMIWHKIRLLNDNLKLSRV